VHASITDDMLDANGFLVDRALWTPAIAEAFAELESITLTDEHWEIVSLVQRFYQEFDASPANRALVKYVKIELGPEKGNSIYLMSLFPGSPTRLASRIAGLPKPKNCL
jgi:tRNA 2-thiouridine synthesizing protein E